MGWTKGRKRWMGLGVAGLAAVCAFGWWAWEGARAREARAAARRARQGILRWRIDGAHAAKLRRRIVAQMSNVERTSVLDPAPQERPTMSEEERVGLRVLHAFEVPRSWVVLSCYVKARAEDPELVGSLRGEVTFASDGEVGGVVLSVRWAPPRPHDELAALMDRLARKFPDMRDEYARPVHRQDIPLQDHGLRACVEAGLREIVLPPFDTTRIEGWAIDAPLDERALEYTRRTFGEVDVAAEFPWSLGP